MFDDLIISKKGIDREICVYDVVDRLREQTDVLISKLGGLSGMVKQPDKQAQIDVLEKAVNNSVEILEVVTVKVFFVTPTSFALAKAGSMWPFGTATISCKEHKSNHCTLPTGKYKSLYLYSWMSFANGYNILNYAECFNRVYAARQAIYKKK